MAGDLLVHISSLLLDGVPKPLLTVELAVNIFEEIFGSRAALGLGIVAVLLKISDIKSKLISLLGELMGIILPVGNVNIHDKILYLVGHVLDLLVVDTLAVDGSNLNDVCKLLHAEFILLRNRL